MRLAIAPITLAEANAFVQRIHRHNGRLPAAKFAIASVDESGRVHGVAIAGLPKARMLCDGHTLEINRVCSDGSKNVCSHLYGACTRAAKAMGYWRVVTYTTESEDGASLRASGWTPDGDSPGGSWAIKRGTGSGDGYDMGPKQRWIITFSEPRGPVIWPEWMTEDESPALFDLA